MLLNRLPTVLALLLAGSAAVAAPSAAPTTGTALLSLSAAQIVDKNVAARGGLPAWRNVKTLSWKGKMTAGAGTYVEVVRGKAQTKERPEAELPFTLEMKRPDKSRLELEFQGAKAIQVFDGASGWKVRPFLGRTDPEPFTPDELELAQDEPGIDGYLIDYAAHGAKVATAGTEAVEGRECYKLTVTSRTGHARHVWVDGQTFLEAKIEGEPRKLDGRPHAVEIYPREFKAEQGVQVPRVLETVVQGVKRHEKVKIDTVAVNPPLDDTRFSKPGPSP